MQELKDKRHDERMKAFMKQADEQHIKNFKCHDETQKNSDQRT